MDDLAGQTVAAVVSCASQAFKLFYMSAVLMSFQLHM